MRETKVLVMFLKTDDEVLVMFVTADGEVLIMFVIADDEVSVMFVRAYGEVPARKIFRRTQNVIKCEGGKKKTKDRIKISDNHIFKFIFHRKI